MAELLDYDKIASTFKRAIEAYRNASPFPHLVVDNLFDSKLIKDLENQFPKPQASSWYRYENVFEKKLAQPHLEWMPIAIREFLLELNGSKFVRLLEVLTGIPNLLVDHEFNGGGLHQTERGGKLDIHADYNFHPKTKLHRRINLILYLNSEWPEIYGGHLEFWDSKMRQRLRRFLPTSNRLVVFNTSDVSFHGHPEALQCPHDQTRKSIAIYYYSRERPLAEISAPHSTLFQRRPDDPLSPMIEELRKNRSVRRF